MGEWVSAGVWNGLATTTHEVSWSVKAVKLTGAAVMLCVHVLSVYTLLTCVLTRMVQYCRLEVTDNDFGQMVVADDICWHSHCAAAGCILTTLSHGLGVWTLFRPGPVVKFHRVNVSLSPPNHECAEGWMSPSQVLQISTSIVCLAASQLATCGSKCTDTTVYALVV